VANRVRITKNTLGPSIGKIVAKFDRLPNEAYNYWKGITPIASGNARRRTRLQGNKIKANYNYAVPLDNGHSSQAPRGMSEPTEEYIRNRIKRSILRK
jgi:hypothetical protein